MTNFETKIQELIDALNNRHDVHGVRLDSLSKKEATMTVVVAARTPLGWQHEQHRVVVWTVFDQVRWGTV